ncbi:hypothetical protein [Opitutus terrae]|uniref:hypothetical protein n=1 Tax=Opitutus terrae TaxID=107709 RepID=UPI0002D2A1AE|nr:hypothetical protein [Opitutus terrae]
MLFVLGLSTTNTSLAAVTWKNIQFGGFASQGFLVNTGNNDYLGDTSGGTFDFREYALNASWSKGKFRVGAQGFGQRLGNYGDDKIVLDWAIVDYQATQWFGIRAGRVKMPRGLYNEALDVDSVRPFVLLPQSVYDARLRDFNSAINGGMIYGNINLRRFGSLDYKAFYGDIPMSTDSGANDYFNNDVPYPNVKIGMDAVYGGSLFWNTPKSGLRVGYSYSAFQDFGADRFLTMDIPPYGLIQFIMYRNTDRYDRHLLSAEYATGDWTFAAEIGQEEADFLIGIPAEVPTGILAVDNIYGYLSATRRINDRLEIGAYYSYTKEQQTSVNIVDGLIFPDLIQHDFAISAKYDINERWLVKVEGHYLDGAGKIFDTPSWPQPLAKRDESWFLLAAKATFSF